MSTKAVAWALEQEGLEMATKLILVCLADVHNGHTGQCNPSIPTLAKQAGCSRRTVERHLSKLRQLGLITSEAVIGRAGQTSNVYTLRHIDAPPPSPVTHTPPSQVSHPRTSIKPEPYICSKFDEFWEQYPKKKSKKKARELFAKLDEATKDKVIKDVVERSCHDRDWLKDDGRYIPYPTTYLNNESWEDVWTPKRREPAEGGGLWI